MDGRKMGGYYGWDGRWGQVGCVLGLQGVQCALWSGSLQPNRKVRRTHLWSVGLYKGRWRVRKLLPRRSYQW